MDLNDFTLGGWYRLDAQVEVENCNVGLNLRNLLNRYNGGIDIWGGLTAGMLTGSAMAIARHLLAAIHFRLGHLAAWQTSERGRDRPQN
jgi:prolipoprotein diacylglyceryltransferase